MLSSFRSLRRGSLVRSLAATDSMMSVRHMSKEKKEKPAYEPATPDDGSKYNIAAFPPDYRVIPKSSFGPYSEYSVIHTDRSLNLMSDPFQQVMKDLNRLLQHTYDADRVAIIPGSGTFGMESVARQFVKKDDRVLVIRNGWFSYRWTEILDYMGIPEEKTTVCKATPLDEFYQPADIEKVVKTILTEKPAVVFMPHVETSTGMMLPDEYITEVGRAVHEYGGIVVLDCIASGTVWVDMKECEVDVLISAPQKGWTGPPCAALVMMSDHAVTQMMEDNEKGHMESSFSLSLKRWTTIMDAYVNGGFAYHTTMPTDALRDFHEVTVETLDIGLEVLKAQQHTLGTMARQALEARDLVSVAAPGYQAPGVLVYYSPDNTANPAMMQAFHSVGLQIAMGVPWKIDEAANLKTFRIGLFGLDKLLNMDKTLGIMEKALDQVLAKTGGREAPLQQSA